MSATEIIVNISAELPCYHNGKIAFGAHLAFKATSKDSMLKLISLGKWEFRAYRLSGDKKTATYDKDIKVTTVSATGPLLEAPRLVNWLESGRNVRFDNDESSTPGKPVDPSRATAAQILQSSITWPAPLPHSARFMHLLRLELTNGAVLKDVLLLPLTEDSYNGISVSEKVATTPAKVGIDKFDVNVKSNLELPQWDEDPPSQSAPIRKDDGFLERIWLETDFSFLRELEAQAGSLISTLPAVLDLPHEKLIQCTPYKLCRLGCILSLDSLLFALVANKKESREGALLSPLVSLLPKDRSDAIRKLRQKVGEITAELSNVPSTSVSRKLAYVLFGPNTGSLLSDPNNLEAAIEPTNGTKVLYELLTDPNGDAAAKPNITEQVLDALNSLLSVLQTESGLEPVFCRIVRWAIAKMGGEDSGLKAAFAKFWNAVQGPFNAADAARSDCGVQFAELIVIANTDVKSLWKVTLDSSLHAKRLDAPADWWAGLPDVSELVETPISLQKSTLHEGWRNLVSRRLPEQNPQASTQRFRPDRVPQALPIPIAAVPAGQAQLNALTRRFNGIGVLIRRQGERWAHANLVDLTSVWPKELGLPQLKEPDILSTQCVQPFLPVAVDGRRDMFLQYTGIPLSSPAYKDSLAPSILRSDDTGRQAFYSTRDSDFPPKSEVAKPPRLAYGRVYEASAFAVTKTGVLPSPLQLAAESPWLPKTPKNDDVPSGSITKSTYIRTTAIGSVTFGTPANHAQQIGTAYPDVFPLALDHSRLSLRAFPGKEGLIDLSRNSDGTGQLSFPSKGLPSRITLEECSISPTESDIAITLEVHSSENATWKTAALARRVVVPNEFKTLTWSIAIIVHGDEVPAGSVAVELPDKCLPVPLWIRVRIQGNTGARSFSFSLPQQNPATSHGALPDSPPVLLVSPRQRIWDTIFHQADVSCAFSRTTWRDWDYWYSNPNIEMYGQARKDIKINADVDNALVAASVLRGEDVEIAKLIDRLPDPAVAGFLIELTEIDTVSNDLKAAPGSHIFLKYTIQEINDAFSELPKTDPNKDPHQYVAELHKFLSRIDRSFTRTIEIVCSEKDDTQVTIIGGVVRVSIRSGIVAHLTVRPFVKQTSGLGKKASTFADAFDPRMEQFATSGCNIEGNDYLVFEGASLAIEGMFDAIWNGEYDEGDRRTGLDKRYLPMLGAHIAVRTADHLREYRIVETAIAKPSGDIWKCFSHVDFRTQRWRFTGRPIYSWINPNEQLENGANPTGPCLELKQGDPPQHDPTHALRTFESELFFDRDVADCEVTRVRLTGKVKTHPDEHTHDELLQSISWELPSATYFRHGFQLISRYAGAILPGGGGSSLWPPDSIPWVRRAAILADATRLEITRPQARCLVPLSTNSESSANTYQSENDPQRNPTAPSPAIACILEEKPFAVGGLADRILAEITTGIGYGFLDKDQSTILPLDLGKETSRDGRIAAWSWITHAGSNEVDASKAFFLQAEGPIGLHFEKSATAAPTYINCEYLLQPRSLYNNTILPDESFVAVQLRRVLSPEWVASQPDAVVDKKDPKISVFLSGLASFSITPKVVPSCLMTLYDGKTDYPILECEAKTNSLNVLVHRKWITGQSEQAGKLELCRIPLANATTIAIVHTHLADGHFSSTVCIVPDVHVPTGTIHAYTPLASISWLRPKEITATDLRFPNANNLSAMSASSQTAREWTRTAKNASYIATVEKTVLGFPQPIRDLRARLSKNQLQFTQRDTNLSVWATTQTAESRMPQYVQRHLLAVFTDRRDTIGRQVDLFSWAYVLHGREPFVSALNETPSCRDVRLHEVEIPSSIIAYSNSRAFMEGGTLNRFVEARLDTVSTGGDVGDRRFYIHFRLANSYESLQNVKSLTLKLAFAVIKSDLTVTFNELTIEVPKGKSLRSFDLRLSTNSNSFELLRHFWDGSNDRANALMTNSVPSRITGIVVSILNIKDTLDELWADVSLLHTGNGNTENRDDFDFNWLFSSTAPGLPQAANRTLPSELAQKTEVQARLISFGDAIPLIM